MKKKLFPILIVCDDPINIAQRIAKDIMKIKTEKNSFEIDPKVEKLIGFNKINKLNFPPENNQKILVA